MTAAARNMTLTTLAAPVALVLVAQNLMPMVNLALVADLGDAALAGLGLGTALYSVLLALLFGLDTGVQVLTARHVGAGRPGTARAVLRDGLYLSVALGLLLSLIAWYAGPPAVALIASDAEVQAQAAPFLRALSPAFPLLAASLAINAVCLGAGRPGLPFLATMLEVPANAVCAALLVSGHGGLPALGSAGAGLAIVVAAALGLGLRLLLLRRLALPAAPDEADRPGVHTLRILQLGLPVSLQQSLLFVALSVYLAIVAGLGSAAVAAVNVITALMLPPILIATGIGIAAATLVGQALGGNAPAEARQWGWRAGGLGMLAVLPFTLTGLLLPDLVLGSFIADPATMALARPALRLLALALLAESFGRVLSFALRGAGATAQAAAIGFAFQWGLHLPLCWLVGIELGGGLTAIAATRLVLYAAETATVALIWRRGRWRQAFRVSD